MANLEVTCQLQVELQIYSITQNGELKKGVKEDGAETRRTMGELHEEMIGKIQEMLANLQLGSNSDESGQQERIIGGFGTNHGALFTSQVRTCRHLY